ncbi:unnamed protein product [Prunus armeniaca]
MEEKPYLTRRNRWPEERDRTVRSSVKNRPVFRLIPEVCDGSQGGDGLEVEVESGPVCSFGTGAVDRGGRRWRLCWWFPSR